MKNIQRVFKYANPAVKYFNLYKLAFSKIYINSSVRHFSDDVHNKSSDLVINYNDIKGAKQGDTSHYVIQFTCKKCDCRNNKMFTKKAYHHGIVVIKCDKCCSFHLIADNLGWFGDKKNIEDIMKEKNEEIVKLQVGGLFSLSNN